jgi:hypothetical protein
VVEETWVEKQTEKLQSLPTATSARELDVSWQFWGVERKERRLC